MPATSASAALRNASTAKVAKTAIRHQRRRPRGCYGVGAWDVTYSSFTVHRPIAVLRSQQQQQPWPSAMLTVRTTRTGTRNFFSNHQIIRRSFTERSAQSSSSLSSWSATRTKKNGKRRMKLSGSSRRERSSSATSSFKKCVKREVNHKSTTSTTPNTINNASLSAPHLEHERLVEVMQTRLEHERKVAAMQARILQGRRLQCQKPEQPLVASAARSTSSPEANTDSDYNTNTGAANNTKFTPDELHILLNSIHHWLLKDPSFFNATMEALDLKLIKQQQQLRIGDSSSDSGSTDGMVKHNYNINSNHHPVKAVWDQYRRLYYDSVPDFRDEIGRKLKALLLKTNDGSDEQTNDDEEQQNQQMSHGVSSFVQSLEDLKRGGFADAAWSRSFRQVRGFQINKDGLSRHHVRQLKEVQRRQDELRKERQHLRDMEEMERLLDHQHHISLSLEAPDQEVEIDNHDACRISGQPVQQNYEDQTSLRKQSFIQQALGIIFWMWSPASIASQDRVPETTPDNPIMADGRVGINAKREEKKLSRLLEQSKRLKKRIIRKKATIQQLEDGVAEAISTLDEVARAMEKMKTPMSDKEYTAGQELLSRTMKSICSAFAQHISDRHSQLIRQYQVLETKTDLTKPHEWYGYARLDRRKIIFHGGPTNSGKTYNALLRLKEAENGLYLGPLRLLAAEIYETLTADAVYTNLYTGQERRDVAFSTHSSATVEMASFDKEYDVVVIDEIQMIADKTRGAAWTKALLGLRAKEIHVAGGMEAKNLVKKLAQDCGDDFEVKQYDRFSKLVVSKKSLATDPRRPAYMNVMPGDCIVAFSRNDIFAIKREIETSTNLKCSVIYGKLPPEIRAEQARKFNDPNSEESVLVASDAIGMGLNLNIRRIIFNSIFKFNGDKITRLSHSEVLQISGRAGRKNSPYPNGEVTCRDPRDLCYIRDCLATNIEPIEKAAILPTAAHIEQFSEALRAYQLHDQDAFDLHNILNQFSSMAKVKGDFFLGRQHELNMVAKSIRNIPLALQDAYTLCLSPTNESSLGLLENFAWKYAKRETSGLPGRPVPKRAKSFDDLSHLCSIYADSDLFLWLQWKFPPSNAMEQAAAMSRKEQALHFINEALSNTDKLKLEHSYLEQAQRHRKTWESINGPSEKIGPSFKEGASDDEDGGDDDSYLDDSDDKDHQVRVAFDG